MSFADLDLANVPEQQLLSDGEYKLQCLKAEEKDSKATVGNKYVQLLLKAAENPDSPPIFHLLMLPAADEDEAMKNTKRRMFKQATEAFGIDPDFAGTWEQGFVGKQTWAIVKTAPEQGGFPAKNEIQRFVKSA